MTLFQSLEAGSSPVSAVSLCQERSKEQRTCAEQFCPHGLQLARFLCLWDFLGKNTGVGCYFLLQGTSPPRDQTCVS